MNNEEINRYIHVEIMGECLDYRPIGELNRIHPNNRKCETCGQNHSAHILPPDYCSDDSPRRLLNEVEANVIEHLRLTVKNPNVIYCRYLMVVNGFRYDDLGYLYEQVIRSTAEQRATACVEAHKLTAKPAA